MLQTTTSYGLTIEDIDINYFNFFLLNQFLGLFSLFKTH